MYRVTIGTGGSGLISVTAWFNPAPLHQRSRMNVNERAAQIWPRLVWAAHNRQTLTYRIVGQCTGMHPAGLGKCLEPIQSYCLIRKFPPLSILVVDEDGMPGAGFIAASPADVPKAQSEVFKWKWLGQ